HFGGPSVRLAGGNARSATCCSIIRSDMTPARRDSAGPSQNRVRRDAPRLPHRFPLFVQYVTWLRIAADTYDLARRTTLPCGRGSDSALHGIRPALVRFS